MRGVVLVKHVVSVLFLTLLSFPFSIFAVLVVIVFTVAAQLTIS